MRALLFIFCWSIFSLAVKAQTTVINTYFQTFGEGDPILLINGGPGFSSEGFVPLAKSLSKENTVIIYDQRGTGKTLMKEMNNGNISLDLMVKDIEDLREQLGYKDWIVMGHSFGGMLAVSYAREHPERTKAMILSSSGGLDLELLNYGGARNK